MTFGRAATWLVTLTLWLASFLFAFTGNLHNDHFDRIVHARQVARYGELPFRDFLDPGYFMTAFASAGLQRLLGDRLLGDLLLDASFIATGTVIVLLLARRVSGSLMAGIVASLLALLSVPRLYDFDKVLFYPLGVLLCWRYIERTTPANLAILGAGIVAGGLFRYDTGLYVGAAAIVAIAVVHWREWALTARRLALLAVSVAIAALPFLLFVHLTAGLGPAADQIATYAIREGARTRISSPPRFSFQHPASAVEQGLATPIRVRWDASVDDGQRRQLAEQYKLRDESLQGEPGERTWGYRLDDPSRENLRLLVSDPRVEDTHGIDRTEASRPAEPSDTAPGLVEQWLGVRLAAGAWSAANATAFVYYLLFSLPVLGIAALIPFRTGMQPQHARIASLAVICVALNVFILRDPVSARIGGMAGPAAIMAAWIAARAWRSRSLLARSALILAGAITVWAISVTADWQNELRSEKVSWAHLRNQFRAVATPAGDTMPYGPWLGMVTYLRQCTNPQDRVYVSWFAPELYFYAQRGFAAGVSVTFGSHWSEPRYQARMIEILRSQPVPVILLQARSYEGFRETYPAFDRYLQTRYRIAGDTSFGDSDAGSGAYRVLVDRNRPVRGIDPASSMPCFE